MDGKNDSWGKGLRLRCGNVSMFFFLVGGAPMTLYHIV